MGEPGFFFRVNPLFLLVLLLFVFTGLGLELLVAFTVVILHEIVHLMVAYFSGYSIYRIEILPFGGMAEYGGLLEMEPGQEARVALAGPLFNLLMAAGLYFFHGEYTNIISPLYINLFIKYNLIIGLFNLIPALPLDGGRILRSILVVKKGFSRGTLLAVKVAKIFALLGGLIGILAVIFNKTNIWVLLISFFVYGAAIKEKKKIVYRFVSYLTRRREYIEKQSVKPVFIQAVNGNMFIRDVLSYLNPGKYNLFYLTGKKRIVSELQLLETFFSMTERKIRIDELAKNDDSGE